MSVCPVALQIGGVPWGGWWIFPADVTDGKKKGLPGMLRPAWIETSHRSDHMDWDESMWTLGVGETQLGKRVGWGKRRLLLRLLDVGVWRLVKVAGAAVCVVVWHVDGGAVQVEVAPAWAARGEAADRTATPGQNKRKKSLNLQHFRKHRLWDDEIPLWWKKSREVMWLA